MPETETRAPNPTAGATAFWVIITGFSQGWKFLISVASTIILARLLLPADFGLVATAAPVVGFIDLLRDAGFSQAIVQREGLDDRQAHSLFWLTMIISVSLGLILVALSPLLAAVFREPRLIGVLIVSALIMQVSAFSSQPAAWLNRHLRFKVLAAIDAIQVTVGLAVSAGIAVATHSYWAIILGSVGATATGAALSFWTSGWRPGRPQFDRGVVQMVKFGAGVSASNIMNFFSRNSDNLLIAKTYGPLQLGFYDRAYKLMLLPLTQISWPISRVLTPVLSRLQGRPAEYSALYLSTLSYIMALVQPALIVATVFSTQLIATLLGAKWSASAPIFAWLGAAGVHQVATTTLGWLYLSQGRAKHYAVVGAFGSVTTIASFLVGLPWGPVGVAAAYTISDYALRLPFSWWYAGRAGPVSGRALLVNVAPHVLAAFGTAAALVLLASTGKIAGLLGLLEAALLAYPAYFCILFCFPKKRILAAMAWGKLRGRLGRSGPPVPPP